MCTMLYPEFATYKQKMEPSWLHFYRYIYDFSSVYAAFRILRKCTYFFDLHENFYPGFDAP